MRLRHVVKRAVLPALAHPIRFERRFRQIAGAEVVTILNLHRVAARDSSAYRPLEPRLFENLIKLIRQRYEVTTVAQLSATPRDGRPRLVLSFEDGYKDFIDVAAPILARNGLLANHNVIPECIETGMPPFNVMTEDFIGQAPSSLLREFKVPGFPMHGLRGPRILVGNRLSAFIKSHSIAQQRKLASVLVPQFHRLDSFAPTPMMTKSDVKEIAAIHEIGAHSFSHASMAKETDQYFVDDLTKCQTYFREELGTSAQIYSFPNGSFRDDQPQAAIEHGYDFVLLVGENFSQTNNAVLNRFTFYSDSDNESRFRTLGAFRDPREASIVTP